MPGSFRLGASLSRDRPGLGIPLSGFHFSSPATRNHGCTPCDLGGANAACAHSVSQTWPGLRGEGAAWTAKRITFGKHSLETQAAHGTEGCLGHFRTRKHTRSSADTLQPIQA